ncbi:MAG: cytochrome P450 [Pseudomonadota bacterium]
MNTLPPKPPSRADHVPLWRYLRLFRQDILSAQPERLYRAKMAAFKTPFFRSYLINDPDLVRTVLKDRPMDFPKSDRIGAGLRPLLGEAVFLTNGETWKRQRRIIDPAFEGGRIKQSFPAICAAAEAAATRLNARSDGPLDIEAETSHAAADVIFRTLFSIPIEDDLARAVFAAFRTYQRSQPLLNLAAFLPWRRFVPRLFRRDTRASAAHIRALITELTQKRLDQIAAGNAPDDLATKILTTDDPVTGARLSAAEMVDQVAIFFLAGHETSAAALSWALYLLATHSEWQDRVAAEAQGYAPDDFAALSRLKVTRDVFRETLRLYPPVPMMVRETTQAETFRKRPVRSGAQVVISPWHLHRHSDHWENPDHFDPARWQAEGTPACPRDAYLPFSAGPRVCTGAGFAMVEGVVLLARLIRDFHVRADPARVPVPVAHLTVRSRDGIWLYLTPR